MKIYHQEVTDCFDCPNYNRADEEKVLNYCAEVDKFIPYENLKIGESNIPEWCPLPDSKDEK